MTVQDICARHGRYVGGECPACKLERARRPKRRTLAEKVRATGRWRRVERAAKNRDGGRCTWGTEPGDRGARHYPGGRCPVSDRLQGHHRVPIEDGGAPYDLGNVRTLCTQHHGRAESEYRQRKEEEDEHGEEADD